MSTVSGSEGQRKEEKNGHFYRGGNGFAGHDHAHASPNFDDAEYYLETLIGDDWQTAALVFQTFDDNKTRKKTSKRASDPYAKVFIGTWEKHRSQLTALNDAGAGVFLTVNHTVGGRTVEHLRRVRAVWCEWDGEGPPPDWPVHPHIIVESSHNKFHYYWLTEDMSPVDHRRVMAAMVGRWGSDPNAVDLVRVLRIPDFLHQKVDPEKGLTGVPWRVRLVAAESRDALPPYPTADLLDAFQVAAWEASQQRGTPPPHEEHTRRTATMSEEERARILADLRLALPHIPAIEYHIWLQVGMGIHYVDSGKVGLDLWIEWSKTCKEKFDFVVCAKLWQGFHADGGVTHRTLFDLAMQHGWKNTGAASATTEGAKPTINISTDLDAMALAAEKAILALPVPVLYQRAQLLCHITPAGATPSLTERAPNTPIITAVSHACLRGIANRAADWMRHDKRTDAWRKTVVPRMALEHMLEGIQSLHPWQYPPLEGLVSVPMLWSDGTIIDRQGYDRKTGFYLNFNGVTFPPIPDAPTREDAKTALRELYEPFIDFPFKATCHQSAAVAAPLTLVARHAIRGSIPMFTVGAHTPGTGKGLLVDVCAMIGTGRTAPTWTQAYDEAEESKRLLTVAMEGDAVVHIDNVTRLLGNAELYSALTATTVKGRVLGRTGSYEAPWHTVMFASGNNMTLTSEMARRVVPIDLDWKGEHPEQRDDFKYPDLKAWVQKNRPRLVVAALTVLKAFFHAGCPTQKLPEFGSFVPWSNLIRQAIVWVGWPDPNEGRATLEAESNPMYEQLATLLQCWGVCYPDGKARTLKVVFEDCATRRGEANTIKPLNEWNNLWDALACYDSKYDGKRLDGTRIGNAIRTIEGTVLDGWRLARDGSHNRAALWKREQPI